MLQRIKDRLGNQAGNLMINSLVGSIVTLIIIGATGAGVLSMVLIHKAINEGSQVTHEMALTDSTFRSDVLWASTITATDSTRVELTVPGQNGRCRLSAWAVDTLADGTKDITVSVINYPSYDATVNPVRCSGTPDPASTQTIVKGADAATAFTYANQGGRELAYSAGTAALAGPATAPAGVKAAAWNSTKLAAVALDTASENSKGKRTQYRISQTADNLSVIQEAADAATHFVPEGNLTALPLP